MADRPSLTGRLYRKGQSEPNIQVIKPPRDPVTAETVAALKAAILKNMGVK